MRYKSLYLSDAIESVNSQDFSRHVLSYLKSKFDFDSAIAFNYQPRHKPCCILECDKESVNNHKVLYEQGAYLEDPFYYALKTKQPINIIKLNEIAPSNFVTTNYFKNFYYKTGWDEETGIILKLNNKQTTGFFFSHFATRNPLKKEEIQEIFVIVKSLITLHLEYLQRSKSALNSKQSSSAQVKSEQHVELDELTQKLTLKERKIVNLILSGNTSHHIANKIFISVGTVKIHRKNIYAKLGINSQCELFALFNPNTQIAIDE